jgi:azurin
LLNEVLRSKDHNVRAAATRVLFYWNDEIKGATEKLVAMSKDTSSRVRLEAISWLSHFKSETTVNALLAATELPKDDYIEYALSESFKQLKPVWMEMFKKDKSFLASDPAKAAHLLKPLSSSESLELPGFIKDDPQWPKYTWAALNSEDYNSLKEAPAVAAFLKNQSATHAKEKTPEASEAGKTILNLSAVPAKMIFDKKLLTVTAGTPVTLVFKNADDMAHNVVVVKPGSSEKVGKAAEAMASEKDGYERNFVPKIPEVLFATPLVNGGKSFRLEFTAPKEPGDYPFICSFPGHWQMMKGVIKVVKK